MGKKLNECSMVLRAYRNSIGKQTKKYRTICSDSTCICGSKVNLVVDHIIPFVKLVNDFEKAETTRYGSCTIPPVVQRKGRDMFCDNTEKNNKFVLRWVKYHDRKSKYQILCRSCNSSKGGCGYSYERRSLLNI